MKANRSMNNRKCIHQSLVNSTATSAYIHTHGEQAKYHSPDSDIDIALRNCDSMNFALVRSGRIAIWIKVGG